MTENKQFTFDRDTVAPNIKTPIVFKGERLSIGEVLDKLNELNDENNEFKQENVNIMSDLDYYRVKSGSCEEGLFQKDKEIAKLEKENKELKAENEQLKETINDLRAYDEEEYIEAKHLNNIYKKFGFDGVIKEVRQRLVYGTVTEMDNLIRISTGGWSDDEALLDVLISSLTQFHYHYVGYIVGGAFYFDPDKSIESFRKVKIIKEGSE